MDKFSMEACTNSLLGKKESNSISFVYRDEENHTKYTAPLDSDEEEQIFRIIMLMWLRLISTEVLNWDQLQLQHLDHSFTGVQGLGNQTALAWAPYSSMEGFSLSWPGVFQTGPSVTLISCCGRCCDDAKLDNTNTSQKKKVP